MLVASDGTTLTIDKIEKEPRAATVYNFEVQDFNSSFVSNLGIWVHNCAVKGTGNAAQAVSKNTGRSGKQVRLKEIANDDKVSTALRGEVKRDINEIKYGKRDNIRVPQGYQMAHRRGYEASKGYGYEHSDLQNTKNHKTQHKYDNNGKKRK